MTSKELLSEVMKKEGKYVESNLCYFEEFSSCMQGITFKGTSHREYWNIYELAHKCKEWATENKYTILTENMYPNGYFAYVLSNEQSIEQCGYLCEHKVIKDIPHNKTEPESIFAACQWILENK